MFEAVIRPYPHPHNYVTASARWAFTAAGQRIEIPGCLYAQQNGVNKTCAQVAIRSLAATYFGHNELSYREINRLAAAGDPTFDPAAGLRSIQISQVLEGLGIEHVALDYDQMENHPDPDLRNEMIRSDLPYQKLVYSGIESGCGALMTFRLSGPGAAPGVGHMTPLFGHTFNEWTAEFHFLTPVCAHPEGGGGSPSHHAGFSRPSGRNPPPGKG